MAYLLYFLNPQLDVTPATMIAAGSLYGVICGVLFGTLLWLLRVARVRLFGRSEGALRYGFGWIAGAAGLSGLVYWAHVYLLRIYLPRGAVRVLSKATILIGATFFVLFLLWLIERNAPRRASRAIFAATIGIILLSAFFLYQRRDGYRAPSREVVYAEIGRVAGRQPVIVVALRNMPFDWIVTSAGEGMIPNLSKIMERGYVTRIEPFRTTSQKALWASLATGQLPHRHGVTGRYIYKTLLSRGDERFSLLPSGVGFRAWGLVPPVERLSPQLPSGESLPFWRFFTRLGFTSTVVNWTGELQPLAGETLLNEPFIRRQAEANPIGGAFASRVSVVGGDARRRVAAAMSRDVAAVRSTLTVARSDTPLTVVALNGFFEATDVLRSRSNTLPPRATVAGDVVRAHISLIDRLVGEIRVARPDALLVIVSPCALQPPPQPTSVAAIAQMIGDADDPGRNDGFVILDGRGIEHRANPAAVGVADIVPSILYAAGLPLARDLDGRVITDAFGEEVLRERPLTMIRSYDAAKLVVR